MSTTLSNKLLCKYDYRYRVDVFPPQNQISTTHMPPLTPYRVLTKNICNPLIKIYSMVQHKPKGIREYVVAAKLALHLFLQVRISSSYPCKFQRTFHNIETLWV